MRKWTQALLGMDVLSLGDFSSSHVNDSEGRWLRFQFHLVEEDWLV